MYGTVGRFKLKPGVEARLLELQRSFEATKVPGYVGNTVYRMDNEPDVVYFSVVFDSRESYHANAADPAQQARFAELSALFAAEPEWHDGEIIHRS